MAKQFTGIDGALYCDNVKIARVSSWTFNAQAAALTTTSLGDFAEKAVYGLQSFSGSCTLYYYEKNGGQIEGAALMTDVMRTTQTPTEPTHTLKLQYSNGSKQHLVSFKCLLNSVSIAASAGAIVTAEVSFQVDGPLTSSTIA